MTDVAPTMQRTAKKVKRPSLKRRRKEDSESDNEPKRFRHVRIRCRQRARKQNSQDEVGFEALRSKDEIIRCICGTQDDLGLLENILDFSHSARTIRTWLIQCCDCKAWQHRSCVGTANENDPLGGFYCEQCSKVKPIDGLLGQDVEKYTIKCVCGSDKDYGNTVYCDRCNTWQHVKCYYPGMSMEQLISLDYLCADCDPRPLSAVNQPFDGDASLPVHQD